MADYQKTCEVIDWFFDRFPEKHNEFMAKNYAFGKLCEKEKSYNDKVVNVLHNSFRKEIFKNDMEWAIERRIEFLEKRKAEFEEEIKPWNEWEKKLPKEHAYLFDGIKEDYMSPIISKLKKVNRDLSFYRNPKPLGNNEITSEDIEIASKSDCSLFIEVRKKDGNRSWAVCPFHDDNSPSLCCYPDGRGYYCHTCHAGGDTISLVRGIYNYGFKEAVRFILNAS